MTGSRTSLVGTLLDGRYRVDSFLARGGTSTVYRGLDTRLDRPVAVKVMDPRFADDPEFLARFEREARSVARLSHPGLVAVHDQGSEAGTPFLVMELVEGGTLRELLRERGATGVPMALAVLEPVLAALAVAHRAGLVHRDVKPENVLVSDAGVVKVADFGLVRAVAAAGGTSTGVILGTAAYLSPEQVTTGDAGPASDVYSAGVLAWELLRGAPPYAGDTALSVAYQHVHREVPRLSDLAHVPPELVELVATATRRDPAARYPDAAAMGDALAEVRRRRDVPRVRVPAPRRSAEHRTSGERHAGGPPRGATALEVRPGPTGTTALARGDRPAPDPDPDARPGADTGVGRAAWAEHRRRARRRTAVWVLVLALLAAAVGTGAWVLGQAAVTTVPTVAGLDASTATGVLGEAGLVAVVARGYDQAPVDQAVGTDPPPGSQVDRDSTVTLTVSAGLPVVPDVAAGSVPAEAEAALRAVTLVPVTGVDDYSDAVPAGAVLAVAPPAGTQVAVGSEVAVARSLGPRPVVVPGVAGVPADTAAATLAAAGLDVVGRDAVFDADVPGGAVVGTDPAAGTAVPPGTAVRLQVSTAVEVPSVRGQSVRAARARLTALGLQVDVVQVVPTDTSLVLGQSPDGGRVAPGSTVRLTALP